MSPPNATTGTAGYLAAAGILKELFQRRASGVLAFSSAEARKEVFVKGGLIIYATSSRTEDRLGDVLLKHGLVSREKFEKSLAQVKATGKKHGTVLVQMEALSPRDLFKGLTLQVREIVLSLFGWEQGDWEFRGSLPPQEEIITLRLNPPTLILEGVTAQAAQKERFFKAWDPRRLTFAPAADPPWSLDDLRLPAEARKVLMLVEKSVPWERMASLLGTDEAEAAALLYTLELLEVVSSSGRKRDPAHRTSAEEGDATPLPSREKILQLAGKIERLNLYQVLRLEPSAPREAIRSSYLSLAREYHPDRFFESEYSDVQEQVTAVFMKINEAYTVLSNSESRGEYDRKEIRLETTSRERTEPDRDSRIAREQYMKGMKSFEAGDAWSAVESFRWAVNLSPRSALYHTWLGAALVRTKKRLHEAEEHCKTAIALDYSNPLFYVHLGQVYKAGRLHQKARKQFETALKLRPGYDEALGELRELGADSQDRGLMGKLFRKEQP